MAAALATLSRARDARRRVISWLSAAACRYAAPEFLSVSLDLMTLHFEEISAISICFAHYLTRWARLVLLARGGAIYASVLMIMPNTA